MKIGHRRTRSASLAAGLHLDKLAYDYPLAKQINKHEIKKLLQECDAKVKEKVCSIEELN